MYNKDLVVKEATSAKVVGNISKKYMFERDRKRQNP